MNKLLDLMPADRAGFVWAQEQVKQHHYLHAPVDPRSSPFAYVVELDGQRVGCLIFGRPENTRCYTGKLTFGSLDDVATGRAVYDRWEILNLARVWLDPSIQKDGSRYIPHAASAVIKSALASVPYDYLLARPPVDCSFPYQIRCVLSYCDTRKHIGWIYMVSRFKLVRTNDDGIQTWAKKVTGLTEEQDARVRSLSLQHPRSKRIRQERHNKDLQQRQSYYPTETLLSTAGLLSNEKPL